MLAVLIDIYLHLPLKELSVSLARGSVSDAGRQELLEGKNCC
jgi:hypothetical protein